jgi:hypothetical protein
VLLNLSNLRHVLRVCHFLSLIVQQFDVLGLLRDRHSTISSYPLSNSDRVRDFDIFVVVTALHDCTSHAEQNNTAEHYRAEQTMCICKSQIKSGSRAQVPAVMICDEVMQQLPLASEYTTVHTIETFGDCMGGLQHQAVNIEGNEGVLYETAFMSSN